MIAFLYELVTGRPWITVRSMAAEFGPPPAVEFEYELRHMRSDLVLMLHGDRVVAEAREDRATRARLALVSDWEDAA